VTTSEIKKRRNTFLIVIVVVVIIIAGASSAVILTRKASNTFSATPSTTEQSSTTTGANYSIQINAGLVFSSANVNFGDGNISHIIGSSSSKSFEASHTYEIPGSALLYYNITASNGAVYSSSKSLIPLVVIPSSTYINDNESAGTIVVNSTTSSASLNPNYPIFAVGANISFNLGFTTEPVNSSYQVVSQSYITNFGLSNTITYVWNASSKMYGTSLSQLEFGSNFKNPGIYYVIVKTTTAIVNSTSGAIVQGSSQGTYVFLDVAVFNGGAISQVPKSVYVDDQNYIGTPNTFDGAIAYNGQALDILFNTLQFLVGYEGNSTTLFYPQLATNLPSIANGEINNNYANYTVDTPWGTNYTVHIKPYENYTFYIRSNATWQDGTPVTAWDVVYSMTRTLLFDAGSPSTPGWIQAQYLLPGNYYTSNTFWNITQNITWNNATNAVTFHFQEPMTPSLVFQIFAYASGAFIMDAAWIEEHGGGITWNAAGFEAYKAEGNAGNYNTYIQDNIMADGPFELEYVIPTESVILIANPNFVSPNKWYPAPTISKVIVNYITQPSTMYLEMSSGQANDVSISSSNWYLVQNLEKAGKVNVESFPTMDMYFYAFNSNINETQLNVLYPGANMPSNFFSSLQVREAFSYAFNYANYFSKDVGNSVYNTTFVFPYAGMLIKGLPGYQSISDLNKTTNGVPYFNLTRAKQLWDSVDFSALGITIASNGVYEYNGKPLVVPLTIPAGNTVDSGGFLTFGSDLSSFIKGASFPEVATTFPQQLSNMVPNENGMTIVPWLWGPDYPYPTDYMGAMAYPANLSFFLSATGYLPYLFQHAGLTSQAANLTAMATEYQNGAFSTNLTYAIQQFREQNEMLVNMSIYLYLGQDNFFWITSKAVNVTEIVEYQENPVIAGEISLLYNDLVIS
jgi:peptide/nickel transport system substrate-binding protein